ncbi:MAG TPA: molybdopterin cofactor-binding domain-containing protein, partial [Streptosporangiaceae bacterium]|nr:molybdopterin cofactor-binding domain-containing protein [Streptosporangiaceae bacterium]
MSILGTRVLRTEDPRFLTHGGIYTADVSDPALDGACYVHFVRASVPHARLRSVDVTGALEAPGVVAAFTAADLDIGPVKPPLPGLNEHMPQPVLASGVVRFAGEPVAIIVTERPHQGEDAAELVDIDYDLLPAVVDMSFALDEGAPLLFPEAGTNVSITFGEQSADDLFDGCEVVVSQTIENQRVAPAPLEVRACAAAWSGERLTAWIPNQGAQGTRDDLAPLLGLSADQIRIITPDVGGAFGAKFG